MTYGAVIPLFWGAVSLIVSLGVVRVSESPRNMQNFLGAVVYNPFGRADTCVGRALRFAGCRLGHSILASVQQLPKYCLIM